MVASHYDTNRVRRIVEDEVEARIERIPVVSSLFIVGGSPREVQVRIDPERLVARGVTFDEPAHFARVGRFLAQEVEAEREEHRWGVA